MSFIKRKIPWKKRPQREVKLNRANAYTKGLKYLVNASSLLEVVSGRHGTLQNGAKFEQSAEGLVLDFDGTNDYFDIGGLSDTDNFTSGNISGIFLAKVPSNSTWQPLFARANGSGTQLHPWFGFETGNGLYINVGSTPLTLVSPVMDEWAWYGFSVDGTTARLFTLSSTSTGTVGTFSNDSNSTVEIGGASIAGDYSSAQIAFGAVWDGTLELEVGRALMRNPYQLLAPRTQLIPVSVAAEVAGLIKRKIPWKKKPSTQNVRLNKSHPLTKYIKAFYLCNSQGVMENIARPGQHRGSPNNITMKGNDCDFEESNNAYFDCGTGTPVEGGALTVLAIGTFESFATGDCRILSKADGTAEADHDFMLGSVDTAPRIVPRFRMSTEGAGSGSATEYEATVPIQAEVSVGERTLMAGIWDGSSIYTTTINPSVGYYRTSGVSLGGEGVRQSTRSFRIGENGDGYGNYDGSLEVVILLDDIALSQDQLQAIYDNPYQILKPRTQFIPVGVVAGVTTYYQSVAGSITAAGALTTAATFYQAVAGSITMLGAIAKKTFKNLSGSTTPSGAITKKTSKTFTGSITPTGTVAGSFTVLQAVAGSILMTGAVAGVVVVTAAYSLLRKVLRPVLRVINRDV